MYLEGKARIGQGGAFLNPKAEFLRNVSVALVEHTIGKGDGVLDATAGTGIRGIRYCLEAGAGKPTLLDMNKDAYRSLVANLKANKVDTTALNTSLQEFANTTTERFDFIDIDPFGGITPYVYDAMKVSRDGTILMLTCTDTAVLCGAHSDACIRLYGSRPMHNELCHESGIRIMVNYVVSVAAQFNYGVEVLLSLDYAHYMRVFLRLRHGSVKAMSSIRNTGYIHYCSGCGSWKTDKRLVARRHVCRLCRLDMPGYGRLWLGPLYERRTLAHVARRVDGMDRVLNEYDIPFFYSVPRMTRRLRLASVKPDALIAALARKGYKATRTQFDDSGIKTDAGTAAVNSCIRGLSKR